MNELFFTTIERVMFSLEPTLVAPEWKDLGLLNDFNFFGIKAIGLYRISMNNRVVFIGRALNPAVGLTGEISSYFAGNTRARKNSTDQFISDNTYRLHVEVLEVGKSVSDIPNVKMLQNLYIKMYQPILNQATH